MLERTDLAKARHELRGPINHILGYCEILLEEEEMPERVLVDLHRIHTGGKQLLELISRYLDEATFGHALDWTRIQHELRTPVNHIIGYSELLIEQANELGQRGLAADLGKIRAAAQQWLALMESHLFAPGEAASESDRRPNRESPPAAPAVPARNPPAVKVENHPAASILVVDDDQPSRELLARRLHRAGFLIATACDGREALALLDSRPFDLLLVDTIMPGMDGLQLLDRIRERKTRMELPVVMVTGRDPTSDVVRALSSGANDYVTKPIDFEVVLARLRTHLELRRTQAELNRRMAESGRLAEELRLRNEFIKQVFGRYVTDEVVQNILEKPQGLNLGGEKRVVTILMSDLRGFTAVAEQLAPETVVELLNQYLGAMANVIVQYRGMIDEFIGDAILAVFGAPIAGPDDVQSAVACALAMQLEMERVNRKLSRRGIPSLEMGIGLNTGEVVVGNIGSEKRTKYGVVGSQVNMAGRIQAVSVGGEILCSEATAACLSGLLKTQFSFTISAKGAAAPLQLHSVIGLRGQDHLDLPAIAPSVGSALNRLQVKCFRLTENKSVPSDAFDAQLTIVSPRSGFLLAPEGLQARSDLKLELAPSRPGVAIYGKTMNAEAGPLGCAIRFTSALPPEFAAGNIA